MARVGHIGVQGEVELDTMSRVNLSLTGSWISVFGLLRAFLQRVHCTAKLRILTMNSLFWKLAKLYHVKRKYDRKVKVVTYDFDPGHT